MRAPGGCPGASAPDLCALGGDSNYGLGLGRALHVYLRSLGRMLCGVINLTCPGLMHVQRPGRRVAGCGSCRRVSLIAVGAVDLRLWADFLACACAFDGFLL